MDVVLAYDEVGGQNLITDMQLSDGDRAVVGPAPCTQTT